jgi:hypothetical protein
MTEFRCRFYLTEDSGPEQEVSMEEWVAAEREAGFNNTMGRPDLPATAGFSGKRISGRVEYGTGGTQ